MFANLRLTEKMARKRNPPATQVYQKVPATTTTQALPVVSTEETSRVVTPATRVPQNLALLQLGQWISEVSTSKVQQAPTKGVLQRTQLPLLTVNPIPLVEIDGGASQATRKLLFSTDSAANSQTVPIRNNRAPNRGKKLSYYPPVLKDRNKVVKLNLQELESQKRKWDSALIGYVIGKNTPFKLMLKLMFAIWNSVETSRVQVNQVEHVNNKGKKKEHNLGSDVPLKNPNRNVSSFSMQLKYEQCFERSDCRVDDVEFGNRDDEEVDQDDFKKLGCTFKELGYCMMDLGLRLAQICDKAIGGKELQQSLLESGTAKGRLIHYHSAVDNDIVKEAAKINGQAKARNGKVNKNEQSGLKQRGIELSKDQSNDYGLWQQWHYDYGIFTVLTDPMFLLSSHQETPAIVNNNSPVSSEHGFPSPSGHTYLQIFDPKKNQVFMVKAPSESLILQVGEAADILSKGKLRQHFIVFVDHHRLKT
ncbi:hypothetical protein K7X08_011137 [Anisodus acutangulus]|uniref:Uncharacterized protein n=1 Tax=Anisodus acutangulus TaxID=402998 RepID=A0A9Q1RAV1_9SOLA|nr:hypothetical protein K7X08_011137 [Anisodus acutangulus]